MKSIYLALLVLGMLVLLLLGAIAFFVVRPLGDSARPSVVIVSPPSGSQFHEGEDIAVQSTAFDPGNVVRVELAVDNVVTRVDPSPSPQGQESLTLIQTWKATQGTHTIMVRAYNAAGAISDPAAVSVTILPANGGGGSPTPVVQTSPLPTIIVITATPRSGTRVPPPTGVAPTEVPPQTPTPTQTPPPPPCSGTPNIESFTASPPSITAGGSSTLSWGAVTNAESAEIDQGIGGVETPGSRSVSPAATTTYTLTARCGGSVATRQATVMVSEPPPSVPAAPSGLTFSTPASGEIRLNWTDNSGNETGFRIYRSGVSIAEVGPNVTTYLNTGLACGAYSYSVRAYNSAGESGASNSVNVSLACPVEVPTAPSNLVGTALSGSTAEIGWRDNSDNEDGFRVYDSISGAQVGTRGSRSGTGTVPNLILSGLNCSQSYDLYVKAYRGSRESGPSNSLRITTDPCTPTNVTASATGSTVTVKWTDNSNTPEETGFKIYFGSTLKKTAGSQAGTGGRATTITGLDCDTNYGDIRVSAYYGIDESPKSSTAASATTSACQVKVQFFQLDVLNDTDADIDPPGPVPLIVNPGEIRLKFTVEGSTQYWPSSIGYDSIRSGDTESFMKEFNLTSSRSNALNINVQANDLFDDPDDMGEVFTGYYGTLPTNFGAGNHHQENGYFRIWYRIIVTSPP